RAYYPDLLNSGVKIFEYQGMIHAKITILDSNIIYIGSANLDQRSFRLNFELGCFVESTKINSEFQKMFEKVIEKSIEIIPENFEKLPWRTKVIDAALHLLSPVL
ncbi:MAG: phospholipase D-like domain-containing protein, partial [Chitinispirillaceae bacterium]|nr:phospholipase D-like domain-containing protein [Chitinispirillaceae bacterium]